MTPAAFAVCRVTKAHPVCFSLSGLLTQIPPAAEELRGIRAVEVTLSQSLKTLARCAQRKGPPVFTGQPRQNTKVIQRYAAKISTHPKTSTEWIRPPPCGQ